MCNVILRVSICNFSNIRAFSVLIIHKLQLAMVVHAYNHNYGRSWGKRITIFETSQGNSAKICLKNINTSNGAQQNSTEPAHTGPRYDGQYQEKNKFSNLLVLNIKWNVVEWSCPTLLELIIPF